MAQRRLLRIAAFFLLGMTVFIGACQARQPVQLSDGLVQQSDFAGQWQWADSSFNLVVPGYARYKNIPAIEIAQRRLTGDYAADKHYVKIFHLLLRCEDSCPSLGTLDLASDLIGTDGETFPLNLQNTGQSTDTQCLRTSDSSPMTACAVEVRYPNIISRVTFYTNGKISKEEIEHILNEMLARIGKRLQEIALQLREKAF